MEKSPDAFRTISEVSEFLETPAHVLRFWESRFPQIKPVKRAGGRRYYRPADVALLQGIKRLLHEDGMTIRGVQKILREQGVKHVSGIADDTSAEEDDAALAEALAASMGPADDTPLPTREEAEAAQIIALQSALRKNEEEALTARMERSGEDNITSFPLPLRTDPAPTPSPRPVSRRPASLDDGVEDLFTRFAASRAEEDQGNDARSLAMSDSIVADSDVEEEAPMALWAEPEPEEALIQSLAEHAEAESEEDVVSDDPGVDIGAEPADDSVDEEISNQQVQPSAQVFVRAVERVSATLDFPISDLRKVNPRALSDDDRRELAELMAQALEIRMALSAPPRG